MIQQITGLEEMRYFDMSFVREKLNAILLAKEENNIHILTCFSLQNVLNGLLIVLQ
jgi:hypothetical protein